MEIIGYRRSDFFTKEGKKITGFNVYFGEEIDPKLGAGQSVERVYLSDSKLAKNGIDIKMLFGKKVKAFFNKFGKIEGIVLAE